MKNDFWLNLPVKDALKAAEFYTAIGFSLSDDFPQTKNAACLKLGAAGLIVMLFDEETFTGFSRTNVSDTRAGSELLTSFDAESKEEVNEMVGRVIAAGGELFSQPTEIEGWMYGFGFCDLDGHRWNMVYMDTEAVPDTEEE